MKRVTRKKNPVPFREAWSAISCVRRLAQRRRIGASCRILFNAASAIPGPLLLIGLPRSIVTFGEDPNEVKKLLADDDGEPDSIE